MVSVIVPIYEDVAGLRRCVRALLAQDYPADRYEVVVVDNASAANVRLAMPDDARFRLLWEGRRGSYAARNTGVAAAGGAVLAFTDGDCVPHPDWLRCGVDALYAAPSVDAVGGAIELTFGHADGPRTGPELYEALQGFQQRKYVEKWAFAATANLFVHAAAFRRVGPFDAGLRSGGDLDWGSRLKEAGGRMVYSEDAVVEHPARSSWRELTRKSLRVANGLADRAAGSGREVFVRRALREARTGTVVWLRVWQAHRPRSRRDKVRYAAAFSFVRLLRVRVQLQRLVARA